jgi:maltodextrin utilization protein YvdJ
MLQVISTRRLSGALMFRKLKHYLGIAGVFFAIILFAIAIQSGTEMVISVTSADERFESIVNEQIRFRNDEMRIQVKKRSGVIDEKDNAIELASADVRYDKDVTEKVRRFVDQSNFTDRSYYVCIWSAVLGVAALVFSVRLLLSGNKNGLTNTIETD